MKTAPCSIVFSTILAFSVVIMASTTATAADCCARHTELPDEPQGMRSIFNGKDLSGWDGNPHLWSVVDGVIHGETTEEKKASGNTFLIWKDGKLKDFDLRLSFRVSSVNNSGIQYRSTHVAEGKGKHPWRVRGYQHEIRNSDKLPSVSGFIYEEGGKRGRMALVGDRTVWDTDGNKEITGELIDAAAYKSLFKVDDWNEVAIIAEGNRLRHYMNGRLVMECIDRHPEWARSEGVLALQLHAGPPMWVDYKNIRIHLSD